MMSTPPVASNCEAVQRLVEVCRAGQTGYAMAGKAVTESVLRAELLQYSGQREEFVAELHEALRACGEEPKEATSVAHPSTRDWPGLNDVLANGDRATLLARCERAEAAAIEAYRLALAGPINPNLRALVHAQFLALSRVRDRIHSLREIHRDQRAG